MVLLLLLPDGDVPYVTNSGKIGLSMLTQHAPSLNITFRNNQAFWDSGIRAMHTESEGVRTAERGGGDGRGAIHRGGHRSTVTITVTVTVITVTVGIHWEGDHGRRPLHTGGQSNGCGVTE
jgi:hypothetical protein